MSLWEEAHFSIKSHITLSVIRLVFARNRYLIDDLYFSSIKNVTPQSQYIIKNITKRKIVLYNINNKFLFLLDVSQIKAQIKNKICDSAPKGINRSIKKINTSFHRSKLHYVVQSHNERQDIQAWS